MLRVYYIIMIEKGKLVSGKVVGNGDYPSISIIYNIHVILLCDIVHNTQTHYILV